MLEAAGPDWIHLQVGGVTLQVFVPGSAISDLGEPGGQVHLLTQLRIRDEQPILYGFCHPPRAWGLFSSLTGVTGVGPRLSLALLSTLGGSRLAPGH